MIKDIHSLIKKEYENRRKAAQDSLSKRENEVYRIIPRIYEIDNEIRATGIKYNKMILLGTGPSDTVIGELQERMEQLKREKVGLLVASGYPPDYLEPVYQCRKCMDTGFVDTDEGSKRCTCYRQQLLNHLFSQSNLKLVQVENFSSFNEEYYPDVVDETKYGISISPRENIRYIKERCHRFIENFSSPDQRSLFFSGPTGTGKSFMINCIAMELIKRGVMVLYQTAPALFDVINNHRLRAFKEDENDDTEYDYISEVELLIIDDLGTESPSAARYAELLTILNNRQANNFERPCKTIISTNIGMKKLYEYYDERVVSRIVGCFDIFRFAGEDIRSIKKFSEKK